MKVIKQFKYATKESNGNEVVTIAIGEHENLSSFAIEIGEAMGCFEKAKQPPKNKMKKAPKNK